MPVRKRKFQGGERWMIDIRVGGKRYRKIVKARTKKDAEAIEASFRTEVERRGAGFTPRTDPWFEDLVKAYLEHKETWCDPKTVERDRQALTNFQALEPVEKASHLTPTIVDRYVRKRRKAPGLGGKTISTRTINIEIRTLKALMNWAVKEGYIAGNPIADVKQIPGSPRKTLKYLSLEEIERILERLSPSLLPIILTFLKTGMRKSELVFLKWEDVDLDRRQITVASEDRASSHHTKTYTDRFIPIDDELVQLLRDHPRLVDCDYVFPTKHGTPRKNNLLRDFKLQCKSIGIETDLHTLRHSYASHLRMAGADLQVVGMLLGHKELKTTKIYEHLSPEFLKETAELNPIRLTPKGEASGVEPADQG